jgi:trehalose 6-phosphate phosphatase
LVEFASRPEQVRATSGLVLLLRAVADGLQGALALISGRPLDDLDRIFAPWQPFAAGVHGVCVRGTNGRRDHQPDPAALAALRDQAAAIAAQHRGTWVEDKGVGVAIHYRAAPEAGVMIAAQAQRLVDSLAPQFALQPGHLVQELRPVGWDKGTAVRELMSEPPFAGRRPVVAGDDLTDEYAFAAATAMGGVAVIVGGRSDTVATYRLSNPSAVRGWLAELLEEVRS